MLRALVIAELDGDSITAASHSAIGAAGQLDAAVIDVAVLAADGTAAAEAAARVAGVTRVRRVVRPENSPYLAAIWAPQVTALAADYSHVFAPATTFGKDLIPRAAALSGVGALSDVTAIAGSDRFSRPIFAGNAIASYRASAGTPIFATIRPTAFEPPVTQAPAPVELTDVTVELPTHTRFIERETDRHSGPELQTADTVVAGGRGLGGEAGVDLIAELASHLGAALGASRAAVDSGWLGNDLQVGQTGKIIAPKLYVGIGISGAIQHLTGIKDAGTIVTINTDADAPICAVADIVLVEDLFTAVPELIGKLRQRAARAGS